MKNRYHKEKMERRFTNEMNYILNNYEKGKDLYPETFKMMQKVVFRADELDNIQILDNAINIFQDLRNKLNDLLPTEKEKELTQNIEMFNLLLKQEYDEKIVQDRLNELKPQYNEILTYLLKEREKTIGRRSFCWNGSMEELEKLYNSLVIENLISKETAIEDFNKVFTYEPISEINKINWTGQRNLLAYLIDGLNYNKQFKFSNEIFSIARECFTNSNNLSKLKFQYLGSKKGYPRNNHIIDNILKTIEPLF
jgi:hypothetical protein